MKTIIAAVLRTAKEQRVLTGPHSRPLRRLHLHRTLTDAKEGFPGRQNSKSKGSVAEKGLHVQFESGAE